MNDRTILVCDDSEAIGVILKIILKNEDVHIETAFNGEEALDYLRRFPKTGLLLLDLKMPKMGGIDFLKIRQEDPVLLKIPVVLLSGNVDIAEIAKEYFIDDYIEKNGKDINMRDFLKNIMTKKTRTPKHAFM